MTAVSIIMAIHDYMEHHEFMINSILSVLNQTFKDFEFIIVDGNSTDGTASVIGSFVDPRVKHVILDHNPGFTKMLNIGFMVSSGKYIARQDADDVSLPNRLEKQVKYLEEHHDVDILGTSSMLINEDGMMTQVIVSDYDHRRSVRELRYGCPFSHGSVMMRRDVLEDIKYDPIVKRAQDYDLWLRIARAGTHRFRVIPDVLYMWRDHPRNVSNDDRYNQFLFAEYARLRFNGDVRNTDEIRSMVSGFTGSRRRYLAARSRDVFYYTDKNMTRMFYGFISLVLQPGYWMNELEKVVC